MNVGVCKCACAEDVDKKTGVHVEKDARAGAGSHGFPKREAPEDALYCGPFGWGTCESKVGRDHPEFQIMGRPSGSPASLPLPLWCMHCPNIAR